MNMNDERTLKEGKNETRGSIPRKVEEAYGVICEAFGFFCVAFPHTL
jgi:hypothetical protein